MEDKDVKTKYFDVAPPEPRKKTSELNMPSRPMMMNDPTAPSDQELKSTNDDGSVPVQVRRELVIGPVDQIKEPSELTPRVDLLEKQILADSAKKDEIVAEPIIDNRKIVTEATVAKEDYPEDLTDEKTKEINFSDTLVETPQAVETPDKTEEVVPIAADDTVAELSPSASVVDEKAPEKPEKVVEAIEDKDIPASEPFASVDGLPDANASAANKIKDEMQEPKIYDTTAYHVAIKETVHGHGGLKGAFIFGTIFAIVVVGVIVFAIYLVGS